MRYREIVWQITGANLTSDRKDHVNESRGLGGRLSGLGLYR